MLDFSLRPHVALVTGASRGIGLAIARTLAQCGAQVAGTATTPEGAARFTSTLAEAGYSAQGFVLDVRDSAMATQLVQTVTEQLGPPLILVNNAGVTRDSLLLRLQEEAWQTVLETNLSGAYQLSRLCLKHMWKHRFGRIINISSVVGFTGNPGQTNYAAAKAGLIGLSKSLALEVASLGITVNVVAPGFIETDMTAAIPESHRTQLLARIPCQRLGKPEEIAQACAFLASKAASYITGHTLHINGGLYM